MAELATMIVSPFLNAFFRKLVSGEFNDFFRHRKLSDGLLQNLRIAFLTVNAVLEDAEELLVVKPAVKVWLEDLKDAVYDAEHVLDEIATEALQSELDAESPLSARKVRKSISAFRNSFATEIEPKIEEILKRLNTLIDAIKAIGLKEGVAGRMTTSLVEESNTCGREDEKETIIEMLLSHDASDSNMGVIAIVGMGGLGKTTLAQLVYNDNRVKQHFNFHVWVCVSDQFDPLTITKTILDRVALPTSYTEDLDQLQSTLKQKLTGKNFLFVLDDVWNQNYVDWENLSKPFKSGSKESRIVVTTRNSDVALTMGASSIYSLKKLGDKDCWSLFRKHAFNDDESHASPQLEELGKQIVEKCDGLPLAIKTIGALLRCKLDVKEWDKILKSELWDLPMDEIKIIPALKLSYKYLPSHVKRCFAYCSIFPKHYAFENNSLILLWMGEGFLHEYGGKTIEEVGDDCFSTLISRSLFQQSSDNKSFFTMHDLVNDLATFISGQFIIRLDDNYSPEKLNKVRHLSYGIENFEGFKKFEFLYKAKKLCTFLPLKLSERSRHNLTKRIPLELLPMLKCLRVLSLSNYENLIELPNSIGKFKHLRYLDLSSTMLQKLPDSICELYNLQVLNLSKCRWLDALPKEMWKLVNLRYLDVIETYINAMPMQLGKLKCLKTLTQFIVGKSGGCCISELGELTNLQGSLEIVGLQNVNSPIDALDARLRDKRCLTELKLEWEFGWDIDNSGSQMVLDNLQPHTNLRGLLICSYNGKRLSNWLGQPSFSKLLCVELQNCMDCISLPALGQLPSLEILSIIGFDEVVSVGRDFYCTNSSFVAPFRALKDLRFGQMKKWEEWVLFEATNGVGAFPLLEKLCINGCPKLIGGLPIHLPSLVKLEIEECPQLVASLPRAAIQCKLVLSKCKVLLKDLPTRLKTLMIDGLDVLKFHDLPSTIEILNIKDCENLEFLPKGGTKSNDYLQELSINQCSLSLSLHKDGLPSALKELSIVKCNNLEFLPEGIINSHSCLQKLSIHNCSTLECLPEGMTDSNSCLQQLSIYGCDALKSLPKGGLPSTLKELYIKSCAKLKSFPEGMINSNNSLQQLEIDYCSALKSFPKGGLPCTLKTLKISECKNFEFPTKWVFPSLEDLSLSFCNLLKTFSLDLFPKLCDLSIFECCKLESLTVSESYDCDLVIERLSITYCTSFVSLPKGGLRAPRLALFWVEKCGSWRSLPNMFPILCEGGFTSNLQLITIGYSLIVRWRESGWENLPYLCTLVIDGGSEDVESFPKVLLLPSNLTTLRIKYFPNLKSLDKMGLQHLSLLECLCISYCPKLKYMPEQRLPAFISLLKIYNCPLLEKQWQSKKGKEWRKIAHIEQKLIDDQLIE